MDQIRSGDWEEVRLFDDNFSTFIRRIANMQLTTGG
jgi:hypothetical protein